jgi:hypothetical protein
LSVHERAIWLDEIAVAKRFVGAAGTCVGEGVGVAGGVGIGVEVGVGVGGTLGVGAAVGVGVGLEVGVEGAKTSCSKWTGIALNAVSQPPCAAYL